MAKTNNLFDKLTFDTTGINTIGGFIPIFAQEPDDDNPKAALLRDIASTIGAKEKQSLRNHTLGKAKAKAIQLQVGQKARKLFGTKIHPSVTKTSLRNQTESGIYYHDQSISLLKKLQSYIKQDKSNAFDFNKFNGFINKTHQHYQDKVSLLAMSQELEMRRKKSLKSPKSNNPLDSLSIASNRLKEHRANMKAHEASNPWPKSNFAKAIDLITEPLMPSLAPAPERIRKGVSPVISSPEEKGTKSNRATKLVDSMRSRASLATHDQNISSPTEAGQSQSNYMANAKGKGR